MKWRVTGTIQILQGSQRETIRVNRTVEAFSYGAAFRVVRAEHPAPPKAGLVTDLTAEPAA